MKASIICVSTICGHIEPPGIGSEQDRRRLEHYRDITGATILGASSLRESNPEMRCTNGVLPQWRKRCIITASGHIPAGKKLFQTGPPPVIFTSSTGRNNLLQEIAKKSTIHVLPELRDGSLSLEDAIRFLAGDGVKQLLIEGGGTLNFKAVQQKVADELLLTLAPRITGAYDTASLFHGPDFLGDPFINLTLEELNRAPVGDEIFLRYRFNYPGRN